MAGYSDTEIESSVSNFVKSDVEVETDALGPVDVENKFNEVVQLISSTLVFDPNAIFYLIYLATNRLNTSVIQAVEYVDDLIQTIEEVGHRTTEVTRTTLLGDAAAALLSVDTILSQSGAISTNAFTRYKNSVDSFIDTSIEPNIKGDDEIIRPAPKAREDIVTVLPTLSELYEDILEVLEQVKNMLDEFNALNLPVLTIQDSVRKARTDLQELQDIFEDATTTRDQKIAECRDAYLRLISGKAVLNNLTTVSDPSEPRLQSTTALRGRAVEPEVDSQGEIVAASVSCSRSAPWDIEPGVNDQIEIAEDGNAPTTYTLIPPDYPSVENYKDEPYDIHGASAAQITSTNTENYTIPAFPDNEFVIIVDGVEFKGNIAAGTWTGAQMITFLGGLTDVDTGTILLGTVLTITYSAGMVFTAPAGDHSIVIGETYQAPIPGTTVNTVLGLTAGETSQGQEANDQMEIDALTPLITLTQGATRTRADIAADITTWVAANFPGEYTAVDDGFNIVITKTKSGAQTIRMTAEAGVADDVALRALETLGFYEGQLDSVEYMSGDEVIDQINDVGKVLAEIARTTYEEGTDGTVTSATTITAPGIDPADDRSEKTLIIRSGVNAGSYRIASNVGPAVVISGTFPDDTAVNQSWSIVDDQLVITSVLETLSTELVVNAASANAELGLTPGTYKGTTTGFRATESGADANFLTEDVVESDVLRIPGEQDREILERSDDRQLEVDPPIDVDATDLDFQILSAAAIAYEAFVDVLSQWETDVLAASSFLEDISELERVMNPLIVNKTPSLALLGDAQTAAQELRDLLTSGSPWGLKETLESFEVAKVGRMEASLNMLQERGLDRAYDFLLDGKITEFFGFDKDDAALSTYMMKSMREVVQEDLPQSKLDEDADDIIHDELVVESDADYDYEDIDEDEGLDLLGEVPDLTDEAVSGVDEDFYRKRY